jgi:predicted nucleic acid binding AN1-type Zn finger protein
MEKGYVLFQVFLGFFIYPFLKVSHIKGVGVLILFLSEPVHKRREVVFDFLSVENTVDHVTTEKSHFNLISRVRVYFFVFMNYLENVRSCRSVGKFELIECFLSYSELITFIKVFDRNLVEDSCYFVISVLE